MSSCTTKGARTAPPVSITDLTATAGGGSGEVDLSWTAPGDDGDTGTAATYAVRYADTAIETELGWVMATDVDGEPTPQPAGTPESMTVNGLAPNSTYYFAIRAEDEAGNASPLSNSPGVTVDAEDAWTLMFYIAADNDLLDTLLQEYLSLREAASNQEVNIVALWDGPYGSGAETRYVAFFSDGSNSERLLGELNTGDPDTLSGFLQWSMNNYPAQHYALTISDHGHGLTGVAYDQTSDYEYLSPKDIAGVLEDLPTLDVLYMHACLMATLESQYEVFGNVEYYVGSESVAWDPLDAAVFVNGETFGAYEIPRITASTTANDLARSLARAYALNVFHLDGKPSTISAVNLNQVAEVVNKASTLASLLRQSPDFKKILDQVWPEVQRYEEDGDEVITTNDKLGDLSHFAELVRGATTDPAIISAADHLINVINKYVVYDYAWSGEPGNSGNYWDHSNSHGVSLFMPPPTHRYTFYKEEWLSFAQGTDWGVSGTALGVEDVPLDYEWGSMLVDYIGQTTPDAPVISEPPPLVELGTWWTIYLPLVLR